MHHSSFKYNILLVFNLVFHKGKSQCKLSLIRYFKGVVEGVKGQICRRSSFKNIIEYSLGVIDYCLWIR